MFSCSAWISKTRKLALLSLMLSSVPICSASDMTYNVNVSVAIGGSSFSTAVGDIVTDGKIGVLTQTDIVGWNLLLTFDTSTGPPFPFDLTSAGSSKVTITGSDLSATATQLLFNFSAPDQGHFEIGQTSPDFAVCFTADDNCPINHVSGPSISMVGISPSGAPLGGSQGAAGTQPIATAVPEPSSWAFVCTGLALLAVQKKPLFRYLR